MSCPLFALVTARSPISLWFKGQRDLSPRNDFNRKSLESKLIATLSQQLLQGAPTGFFR
jgi:hypothetical protein